MAPAPQPANVRHGGAVGRHRGRRLLQQQPVDEERRYDHDAEEHLDHPSAAPERA